LLLLHPGKNGQGKSNGHTTYISLTINRKTGTFNRLKAWEGPVFREISPYSGREKGKGDILLFAKTRMSPFFRFPPGCGFLKKTPQISGKIAFSAIAICLLDDELSSDYTQKTVEIP